MSHVKSIYNRRCIWCEEGREAPIGFGAGVFDAVIAKCFLPCSPLYSRLRLIIVTLYQLLQNCVPETSG